MNFGLQSLAVAVPQADRSAGGVSVYSTLLTVGVW